MTAKAATASPVLVPERTEAKVAAAVGGAAIGEIVANLLGGLIDRLPLPGIVKTIVKFAIPLVVSFVSGYFTPHTFRVSRL